jgi:hypothetical protein
MLARFTGAWIVCGALFIEGCGSADCAETATCPAASDGSTSNDAIATSLDNPFSSDGNGVADAIQGADAPGGNAALDAFGVEPSAFEAEPSADEELGEMGGASQEGAPSRDTGGSTGAALLDSGAACDASAPENCTDGVDDNCNTMIDCADQPACSAYECASSTPDGWIGPAVMWTGSYPAAAVPECPAGYATAVDGFEGLAFSPDACGCECTASGQTCSGNATLYTGTNCAKSCVTAALSSNACTPLVCPMGGASGSWQVTGPVSTGGTCSPTVTTKSGGSTSWQTAVRVCAHAGRIDEPGGCANGDQCVPKPTAPYGSSLCVYQAGVQTACPAPFDASPHPAVLFKSSTDTRGCGACTCSATPTPASCSGRVDLHAESTCGDTPRSSAPGCLTFNLSPVAVQANYALTAGTCSVTGMPAPTGTVTPTNAYSVCCM